MNAVGGFFELELPREGDVWHERALTLTSGRACLRALLQVRRPERLAVPFYICDAALAPIKALGVPFEFYAVTTTLEPAVTAWTSGTDVLVVNYFDLSNATVERLAGVLGERLIVDDTQAFFRRRAGTLRSFNSARKFFGVPDGAYAYGPGVEDVQPAGVNDTVSVEHLITKLIGQSEVAYRQYVSAEAAVSSEPLAPSSLSRRLLRSIAYSDVRAARRENFVMLHDLLGGLNTLHANFALDADAAPFCYPLLPARGSFHEALWRRRIFVPRLWPDVVSRSGAGFDWERDLAARLLPLPIDQRYGRDDMARVAEAVAEVAA